MADEDRIRLQVFLARAGVASRRASEQIISEGRVQVNGETVTRQGIKVLSDDTVHVDGKPVKPTGKHIYLALHKPRGFVCSNSDPEGRPLAIELLRVRFPMRLFPVGRLDINSSGLILFTNDGDFAQSVAHPSNEVEKEYEVQTRKPVPDEFLDRCKKGVRIEGEMYQIVGWKRSGGRSVRIRLVEGKNRELRTLFDETGYGTKRVHRVRIGTIELKGIAPGHFRHLTGTERSFFTGAQSGRKQ